MANYCTVCGRLLKKSNGPIGPHCFKKLHPGKVGRFRKMAYNNYLKKHDLFSEENRGQKEDGETSSNS